MSFLKVLRQVMDMLPNVVQQRRNCPLNELLLADFLWCDVLYLYIVQELFRGFPDLFQPLSITVLHAIWTLSSRAVS